MRFLLVIVFCLTSTFSRGQNLLDSIYTAQFLALNNSLYKEAPYAGGFVKAQRDFRIQYFPKVIKDLLLSKKILPDTLWIVEEFKDDGCFTCSSYDSKILFKDKLFIIRNRKTQISADTISFDKLKDSSDFKLAHHEIFEVKERIAKNKSWNSDALKYGLDGCADGNHVFLTLVLPTGITQSVYVRCWYNWVGKKID